MATDDKWCAIGEHNPTTGMYRIVCQERECTWVSREVDAEWKADLAAQSHAESVHGTVIVGEADL